MKKRVDSSQEEDRLLARIAELNEFDEKSYRYLVSGRLKTDLDDRDRVVKALCLYARAGEPVDYKRIYRDFHVPERETRELLSSFRPVIAAEEDKRTEVLVKLMDKSAVMKGMRSENPQMIQFVRHEILGQKGQADVGKPVQIGTLIIQVNQALRGRVREEASEVFEAPIEGEVLTLENRDCTDGDFVRRRALSTEMFLGNTLDKEGNAVLKVSNKEKGPIK